jgi:UDP-N-acetyl-2-amino-2-deoxyglucuronate dehydrogenase
MEPVKLGVIGCGVIGSVNLRDAMESELTEVVAAADLRVERREWAQEQGVPRVYEDGRDLLDEDPEVEAVIVAFPAAGRTAMVLRAFARGKHVIDEKPVAMNAREVETMIGAQGDLVAGCFSARMRAFDSAEAATKLVASGALGDLRMLHVRVHVEAGPPTEKAPPPWRESFSMNAGGILTNWSCYDMDYILGIAGWSFRPRTALAQTWPCVPQFRDHVAPESDADSYFAALVVGEGGTVLSIERGEFMPAHAQSAWQIVGTKGSLTLSMSPGKDTTIVHDDASGEEGVVSRTIWEGDDTSPGGNRRVIEDFALAVREGRPPLTSLENALVIAQITDAIYESAARGTAVEMA